uniref:HNH nuclease domain-containing protein n=2 Tax=Pinguiococcus pyrenoidosus TaxID=172671 RepID=A0A7R9UFH7_9STRA|mmetsp:Transcript_8156/g.30646  ORF Transcript_8156/g.30646 Transcript_8156/m.30646 type:complete len:134 (+) Transcript_8156:615-1016(+)
MPLSLWSWQETIKAVLLGKVSVVERYPDVKIHTIDQEIPLPSVIALKEYVKPDHKVPAFTRRNLYLRDNYRCAYCARYFYSQQLSYDHVLPRFYGGSTSWDNVVTSCTDCNGRKGNLHPSKLHEIGMRSRAIS